MRLRQPLRRILRIRVALLDEKPVLALAPSAHPHQRPASAHSCARQTKAELAAVERLRHVPLGLPDAAIPQHDSAAAILALGNRALETAVAQRMILGADREPLFARIPARPFRHRPAQQHAVPFQPEIVMQPPGRMLLHHEPQSGGGARPHLARRFPRPRKIALYVICVEPVAAVCHLTRPFCAAQRRRPLWPWST